MHDLPTVYDGSMGVAKDGARQPTVTEHIDQTGTLRANPKAQITIVHATQDPIVAHAHAHALGATDVQAVHVDAIIRRLTPLERDRLMGWGDDYTRWGVYDDGATRELSMTARDRITGNGIVAGQTEWVGRRIIDATPVRSTGPAPPAA